MTLEEVARRARVSTATVSRVLNERRAVKSSTRARVLKVMQELKYSPNLHAQSLAGGRSRSIGVIVSNIENPFFLDVYKTVEAGAHAAGYERDHGEHRLQPGAARRQHPADARPAARRGWRPSSPKWTPR